MRVTFELSENDLNHFRNVMHQAVNAAGALSREEIISSAQKLLNEVNQAEVPTFVSTRLEKLSTMISMVEDSGWALPEEEKARVLSALAYFSDPEDLIPDHIPGLGFLDDAIMIELVVGELKHEIQAFQDFCNYRLAEIARRGSEASESIDRVSWLVTRRKQLHSRMRTRRGRDRTKRKITKGSSFSLW